MASSRAISNCMRQRARLARAGSTLQSVMADTAPSASPCQRTGRGRPWVDCSPRTPSGTAKPAASIRKVRRRDGVMTGPANMRLPN